VAPADSLTEFLSRARREVDDALERYLPRPPECPRLVSDAMRYSLFAGGKRLRPILTLAAGDAVSRRTEVLPHNSRAMDQVVAQDRQKVAQDFSPALPAACAIEMIHTYSLIHDDLPAMDNDTLRRGRPTLHVVYGDGIAILAGDGLQAAAFTLLAQEPASVDPMVAARKLRVAALVGAAAGPIGMVAGQAIDLQAVPSHAVSLDAGALRDMHARKTGALIRAAAVSGAIMVGGEDAAVAAVDAFAAHVGLAFQIVDDILDVEGTDATLGKSAGKDAAAHKPTYPALFGLDRSRALATECLEAARKALVDAGLTDGWLLAVAEWVVARKN